MAFLRLIRSRNLLIVALTQYLMRFCIIEPILKINNFELQLSEINFFILVLSTVLITAAGYIINDYFDRKADLVNRPNSVVVDKQIHRRLAMKLHIAFNIVGVLLGVYLSIVVDNISFSVIYFLIVGLLWYYSTTYKRQFLIGNIIVALLTALVPFMVLIYEIPLLNTHYKNVLVDNHINFNIIIAMVSGFSFFAFVTTLFREIVKDMEDFEGDYEFGRNSLPVILGMNYTKIIVIALIGFTIFSLFFAWYNHLNNILTFVYFSVLSILMIAIIILVIKAKDRHNYKLASGLSKVVMVAGLLYSLILRFF